MSTLRQLFSRLNDLSDGPVGTREWCENRSRRFEGVPFDPSEEQKRRLRDFAESLSVVRDGFIGPIIPAALRQPDLPPPPSLSLSGRGSPIILDDGRLDEIAESDDTAPYAPVDHAAKVRRLSETEQVFHRICEEETGVIVDPDLLAKKKQEKAELRAQSHVIARKLGSAGVPAYRSEQWSIWTYGIHSGEVEIVPQFRRIAFIPYVAATIREPYIRALEFFLQRNLWCRFWTFTAGPRVPLRPGDAEKGTPHVRNALRSLHRRLSELNAQPFMRQAGVEIVFRSSELGTVEAGRTTGRLLDEEAGRIERDADGTLWFHPHAHCVVSLRKGRLSQGDWSRLLGSVWEHWGNQWDDGGAIRTVREACKYVTKPAEIERLTADETKELFLQLRRLKLVQPMGALAAEMQSRESAGRTLIRQRTDDGFVWREVDDWNKREGTDDTRFRVSVVAGEDTDGDPVLIDGAVSERSTLSAARLGGCDADACVVVARCVPAVSSIGIKEPRVVVMGKRWDESRVSSHPLVERLRLATSAAWKAAQQLIRVHTGTPTVGGPAAQSSLRFFPDVPERSQPPSEPVFIR